MKARKSCPEYKGAPALDAGLLAAAQAVETLARSPLRARLSPGPMSSASSDASPTCKETLAEEKKTDQTLTGLAKSVVNAEARRAAIDRWAIERDLSPAKAQKPQPPDIIHCGSRSRGDSKGGGVTTASRRPRLAQLRRTFVGNIENHAACLTMHAHRYHDAAGRMLGKETAPCWANSARARLKNSVTPKIMITTEISRPSVPDRVMSPKPVVVSAVTVKYRASA